MYADVFDAFVALFPGVSAPAFATSREAVRLLARSIVCVDRVIDRDVSPAAQTENVLAAQICQLEASCLLQAVVPLDHPFWADLVARVREFAESCVEEAVSVEWSRFEDAVAERIAIGKNAVARVVGPLACALGGTMASAAQFDRAITNLIVAVQSLDDAIDWRDDLAAGRLSLVSARIWSRLDRCTPADEVRSYVLGRVMPQVLACGREALASAIATPVLQSSSSWLQLTGKIADGYDHALAVFGQAASGGRCARPATVCQ